MPVGYKIALFGTGYPRKAAYAGMAALTYCEAKNEKAQNADFDFDILKIIEPADYTSLVKAYRNVQRKYNLEKDILIRSKDKKII